MRVENITIWPLFNEHFHKFLHLDFHEIIRIFRHKRIPSPEPNLNGECRQWRNNSCCSSDTSKKIHNLNGKSSFNHQHWRRFFRWVIFFLYNGWLFNESTFFTPRFFYVKIFLGQIFLRQYVLRQKTYFTPKSFFTPNMAKNWRNSA